VVGFIVPPGTTAVSVPRRCHVFDGENLPGSSEPGKPRYVCVVDNVVPVGATQSWEFELRLDREGESKGSVRANEPMTWTNGNEPDLKPANDQADVVVNAVKSGAGNPPAGGAGGGGAGGAAAGLPVTGSNAVLLAGGGALLVALGGVGYLVARRRRTRFVA
jgi:LPXTG-motif cell wall-anchored protein